ncbi:MAG: hypothetical protein FIA99_19110 [Ruminiclostridium sp.]|nr:hypothetical protein [Ruminiclostridium sp.]
MSVAYSDNPKKRIELINNLAATGKSRSEIAKELGYSHVGGLTKFAHNQGFEWNYEKGLYAVKGTKQDIPDVIEETPTGRVASIISMFEQKMDGKEIAKSLRFGSYQEMADYLKSKGYTWDNAKQNYIKIIVTGEPKPEQEKAETIKTEQKPKKDIEIKSSNSCDCMEKYSELLKLIDENRDRLAELLNASDKAEDAIVPRYKLHGLSVTKSIDIPHTLDQMIKEYSNEHNLSQREIVQIALVEFLKKYGYENEVKTVLHV